MRQRHLNILLIIGIIVCLVISLWPDEKTTPIVQPINYELFEHKFKEIDKRFEIRDSQDLAQDTIIQSMKLTIVTDEKTIRNATNNDVDSIFNSMVARQRKSSLQ